MIKEEAENAGEREVFGFEYRGRINLDNPFADERIDANLYYTYTDSRSSITYDQTAGEWLRLKSELGDIAPHKINAGLTVPIYDVLKIDLRANWVSERRLYSRNPLRARGTRIDDYLVVDLSANYEVGAPFVETPFTLGLKIRNLFDERLPPPGSRAGELWR